MQIDDIETPAAIVDLDQLQVNINKLQTYMDQHQIINRPHIKTHKIPEIAHMQVKAGAKGVTCQKIGEAEVMADAGITDIFLPYNILGKSKLQRLMALNDRVTLSVTADSSVVVDGLCKAVTDKPLTVFVECDTGTNRCGVQSPQEARLLAQKIEACAGLNFGGLMTYPSTAQANTFMEETIALLAEDGIPVPCVSGGGTPQMWHAHEFPAITEHRAGMYIYGDRYTINSGAMTVEECSFKVLATVVSRPTEDRGILDSGSKTLSSDILGLDGHGLILEYPEAHIYGLSEEHGHVDFSKCAKKPAIGERVTLIPNHCCVVNNLFNEIVAVRGDRVEHIWPVAARGRLQ